MAFWAGENLVWKKYHDLYVPEFTTDFPLVIGMSSSFPKGADFSFEKSLLPGHSVDNMVHRAGGKIAADKVYLPAVKTSGHPMYFDFLPFVLAPEAKFHQIEFHRLDSNVFMICARHGEDQAFGFSYNDRENPHYLRLAFPNETGKFPDTFILVELKNAPGEIKHLVLHFVSDFARPQKFEAGKPVPVFIWFEEVHDAPDCLKMAAGKRMKDLENIAKAEEFERGGYRALRT